MKITVLWKRVWKRLLIVVLVVTAFGIGSGIFLYEKADRSQRTDGKLQIHFIDVGQGDCALLILPTGERLLIDTGTRESAEMVLAHLNRWEIDAIDLVLLSHTHADHAGGLDVLEDAIPIGGILYCGEPPADTSLQLRAITPGDTFSIGEVVFSVLGPLTSADSDNRCMILRIDYGEQSFLFTGDAEEDEEERLVNTCPALLDVRFLKVAHHGSKSSSTEAFLNAVTPEIAVVSASEDNSYGHPAPTVITRLKQVGCRIYRTDREGTLIFLSDGKYLTRYYSGQLF